ncbi:gamma-glutamylcyclotransferase [Microbacterium sp. zg-Y818]|uniref:gamma-glutamylcyclotransferase n=1 Tax=unclassified Microbacterium TaxID=2609290 RepID=UPI00214BDC68|nr:MULTISPECIES: gamma-glutamylcyclotransferase [unclassified Microbacterium]MCR2799400.1 gamma-glutamylcyclotransferase [Microbacterium sp. zg.Y818]WIM21399.1 gamma-glutamylcyclotransferase [Microbacterium sp. zg-Y818]
MGDTVELLFSYGSLEGGGLQLDTFGRVVHTEPDVLPGYTTSLTERPDPRITDRIGPVPQRELRRTGDPRDKIIGTVLRLSEAELDAADELLSPPFHRRPVTLESGRGAWVYVVATT